MSAAPKRETVELVTGERYYSDDHWRNIFKVVGGGSLGRQITGKAVDRIRYIALVQHGGGRDETKGASK